VDKLPCSAQTYAIRLVRGLAINPAQSKETIFRPAIYFIRFIFSLRRGSTSFYAIALSIFYQRRRGCLLNFTCGICVNRANLILQSPNGYNHGRHNQGKYQDDPLHPSYSPHSCLYCIGDSHVPHTSILPRLVRSINRQAGSSVRRANSYTTIFHSSAGSCGCL
jgi:hypothetical protein